MAVVFLLVGFLSTVVHDLLLKPDEDHHSAPGQHLQLKDKETLQKRGQE
jgi:hypothetical protein